MVGQTLGHYRILEKIGSGGMGAVYRARDERLERDVALKVLPEGTLADEPARKRFRQEALALSRLNHPNIATVHDFDTQDGRDFLVMECIPGTTLDRELAEGPLPEKEVCRLGAQLAEGLAAAHGVGLIHRDLKPANLRMTPDRRLKILDFGLAKLLRPEDKLDGAVATESLAETQGVAGTLPYMAPEQLRGEKLDARTDLYAAGAVLYEMATGQRPFPENQGPRLIDAILHQPPRPPTELNRQLSPPLESIILKALDKEPERRYQSAKDLQAGLERASTPSSTVTALPKSTTARGWWVRAAGVALLALAVIAGYLAAQKRQAIDSLAVLPFENANGDRDAEYLSDGITETLIDNLSQLPRLKVMSRNSVFRYKGRLPDAREAGRELGVRAVLTGRIVQRGDDLSISAELVDARDNSHLWGEHFTRRLADVLAVQEEISTQISQSLRLRLSGDEKRLLTRRPTENTEAYQLYLKGRYYWRQFTAAGTQKAIGYFEQAIQKDPNYALAYAGLADSYAFGSAGGGGIAPAEGMPKARTAATSALEIDDALPEAHLSLALVKAFYDWDWSGADKEFRRCLELNPNYAEAHHMYSHYFVALGRIKESFSESQRALELEPLSYDLNWHLGWHYYYARQYDQAIEQLNKAIELSPNSPQAILVMAFAYEQKGDFARATAEVDQIRALSPNSPFGLSDLAHIYAVSGRRSEAVRILEQLDRMEKQRYIPASYRAVVYAGLGDKTQALDWLERVCQEHGFYVATLKVDPRLDPLRSQPRFQALLRRVGLPP